MATTIKTNIALSPATIEALHNNRVTYEQGDEFARFVALMGLKYSARLNDSHAWPNQHIVYASTVAMWTKVKFPETLCPSYRGSGMNYQLPFGGTLDIFIEGEWAYKAFHPADIVVAEAILEALQVPQDLWERNEKFFRALPGLVREVRKEYAMARGYQTEALSRAQAALSDL
jgi:hypothetical protein